MIIGGYGEELLAGFEAADPRRTDIEEILKASERLANLTRQLTELSRPTPAEDVSLELNEWAAGYAVRLRQSMEADQEVDFVPARRPVVSNVPPALLERFFDDAIRTTRPALPAFGRLLLEVIPARGGAAAQLGLRFGGADFDTEVRERFFEPFSGPKEGGQDPPLGLAGDIRPLAAYGVRVRLEGEPGEDPRLVLQVPQVEEAPAPPKALAAAAAVSATILLVEDEASIRSLVRKSLRREGYDVVDAGTTEDGIATARNHPGHIDLLVTDIMVPLINGRALAAEILRQYPAARVLFISGYSDDAILESGTLPPEAAYLRKPFTLGAMLEKVRELLTGHGRAAGAG
jgi:CheY-like chemotaxis protein